jgi:PAS domain S-box-containing protein
MALLLPLVAGALLSLIGVVTLAGWFAGSTLLIAWSPSTAAMAPITALLTIATGVGIQVQTKASLRRVAQSIHLVVAIAAAGLLVIRLLGWHFAWEPLGLVRALYIGGVPAGYISPITAAGLLIAAAAMVMREGCRWSWPWCVLIPLIAGAVVSSIGVTCLLTDLVGVSLLSSTVTIPPAINTSVALVLIGISAVALGLRREGDFRPAGTEDRAWLPLVLVFAGVVFLSLIGGSVMYRQEEQELRTATQQVLALEDFHEELWHRLGWVAAFVGLTLFGAASSTALIWRNQRARHDRQQARLADACRVQASQIADLVARSSAILYTLRVDEHGSLTKFAVSENVERLLGFSVAEVMQHGWWTAHLHPDDRHAEAAAVSALATGDTFTNEYRFVRKDGTVLWVSDQMTVTRRGSLGPLEVTGSWHDVTARYEADRAIRERDRSLLLQSAALCAAANAMVITGRDGTIEWVNPAFCELTQFDAGEVIGRNPRDVVRSGHHGCEFYEDMWDTIVSGRVWNGELLNRRKDGTTYWEHQTITPVLDPLGVITHFISVKRDLTKEKSLQAQFVQAQKMEAVGRLAGGIAHDFNNMLTVILGECELAQLSLDAADPVGVALGRVLDAGQRAARLTRQLLTFSRKQLTAPAIVSARAHVAEFLPMLKRLIGEDITLTLSVDDHGELDHVLIDRSQFEQVILNLAVNARDAMPHGGALQIRTGVDPANAQVVIAVTDTGTGIPPELLARLFEPFFTTKAAGKGTGLGLATCFGIVTQCGGTITVESEVGRGTTFRIALPRSAAPAAAALQPSLALHRGAETIVLVEDEREVRELVARLLRAAGYAVIPMESAASALAWFERGDRSAELLMTDVVMPGMTGTELAAAVHRIKPDLPVLFASGYSDESLSADAIADPDRFIAKPFTPVMIAAKVHAILNGVTSH